MMRTDQDCMFSGPWVKHNGMRLGPMALAGLALVEGVGVMGHIVKLKFKAQVGLGTTCRTHINSNKNIL